jgi:hypothetical protein
MSKNTISSCPNPVESPRGLFFSEIEMRELKMPSQDSKLIDSDQTEIHNNPATELLRVVAREVLRRVKRDRECCKSIIAADNPNGRNANQPVKGGEASVSTRGAEGTDVKRRLQNPKGVPE